MAELVPTEFRDHLTLGYEILKWETDTPTPTLFHPLHSDTAQEKVTLLQRHYPSQLDRDWFDETAFDELPGHEAEAAGLVQLERPPGPARSPNNA